MPYKRPYSFGGGRTDDLYLATSEHILFLTDCLDTVNHTVLLLAIAIDQIDSYEDSPELTDRVRVLLDCLRGRLTSELEAVGDSMKLLREFYPTPPPSA
jgi:hypothetical protein